MKITNFKFSFIRLLIEGGYRTNERTNEQNISLTKTYQFIAITNL